MMPMVGRTSDAARRYLDVITRKDIVHDFNREKLLIIIQYSPHIAALTMKIHSVWLFMADWRVERRRRAAQSWCVPCRRRRESGVPEIARFRPAGSCALQPKRQWERATRVSASPER